MKRTDQETLYLIQTKLIKDADIETMVSAYIENKKATPEIIPQIKTETPILSSPTIKNARIYLLAGISKKTEMVWPLVTVNKSAKQGVIGMKR